MPETDADAPEAQALDWHDPTAPPFRLAGFAWWEQDRAFRRLPRRPEQPLPEAVDRLANATAGGQIQFRTDSKRLAVRVQLAGPADMNHMPATGQCGFDCYVGPPGEQRFAAVTKYDHTQSGYEVVLLDLSTANLRNVTLNFPLYRGVEQVSVGLERGARIEPPPPYADDRPVVVYGTSITQGGCAARPGMAYTNILSRRLNRPFVNLGFSGSGRGEPEVARCVAAVPNPALFLLDYEANAWADRQLERTLPGFIDILRERHAETPILVVSKIRYPRELLEPDVLQGAADRRAFQRDLVDQRRAAGDANVHFLDGAGLLGDDFDECTVDGSHPTTLGFWRMARGLEPALRRILSR